MGTLAELLGAACADGRAIPAFNVVDDVTMWALLLAAERTSSMVIVQMSVRTAAFSGPAYMASRFRRLREATGTEAALHLDHCPVPRLTQQRAIVLEALMAVEGFVGAQALHNRLTGDGTPVGLSTVYRTLTAFAEAGRADIVRDSNGERLFRYRPGPDHRHYLICTACGLSRPVDSEPVETWAEKIARTSGFANVRHTVELAGLCPDCNQEQARGR